MLLRIISLLILSFSSNPAMSEIASTSGHTLSGTQYDSHANKMYEKIQHGPDGKLFLDPFFLPFIENINQQRVLDAGCGAGPWAIYAAHQGALVSCLDIQQEMIARAKEAAQKECVIDKIDFFVGDVASLPYQSSFFDRALSINVGCNLPSTTQTSQKQVGLGPHFTEIFRVLKSHGKLIITAPASFDVIFTSNNCRLDEAISHIHSALSTIKNIENTSEIVAALNTLTDIHRATFVIRDNNLKLVTSVKELVPGENIWRKLPGLAVPNRYHPEEEYIQEGARAGFKLVRLFRERFKDENARQQYNASVESSMQLGKAYVENSPFIVLEFEKI